MTDKNTGFPSAPQALLLVVALYALEYAISRLFGDAQSTLALTEPQAWALTSLLANGVVFATVMQWKGLTYRELFHPAGTSMRGTAMTLVPWVLLLVPALVLNITMIVNIVARAYPLSPRERELFDLMGGADFATILVSCAIAPVVEEMLFRGVILRGFLQRYGRAPAIWGTAVLFGAAHLNLYQFVAALLMGAVCGWLYERSRSLVPCIALHAGYNSALELLSNVASDDNSSQLTLSAGTWLVSVLLAGFAVEMLRRAFARTDA